MATYYQCSACGQTHSSRLRAPDAAWLYAYLAAAGEVLERCPAECAWVRLERGGLEWRDGERSVGYDADRSSGAC